MELFLSKQIVAVLQVACFLFKTRARAVGRSENLEGGRLLLKILMGKVVLIYLRKSGWGRGDCPPDPLDPLTPLQFRRPCRTEHLEVRVLIQGILIKKGFATIPCKNLGRGQFPN